MLPPDVNRKGKEEYLLSERPAKPTRQVPGMIVKAESSIPSIRLVKPKLDHGIANE